MKERISNASVESLICKDCQNGHRVLQKIITDGHEDITVYYKTIFGIKAEEMLPKICPEPRPRSCPFKNKKDI